MIVSFDIHEKDGDEFISLEDLKQNNFGYKKNERLFIMDVQECFNPDDMDVRV